MIADVLIALRSATVPAVLERRDANFEARMIEYQYAAQALMQADRFEDALRESNRLRAQSAGHPECSDEARTYLLRARAAFGDRPRSTSAWFILGQLHIALGDRDEARASLERYLKASPDGNAAAQARELLAFLGDRVEGTPAAR